MMQEATGREFNINYQAKLLAKHQRGEPLIILNSSTDGLIDTSPDYLPVCLSRENIIDIQFLAANPEKTIAGKFLLCRTITPAVERVGIEAVVEDPSGELALRLELHYCSTLIPSGQTRMEHVLPTGFILAVKNPTLIKSTSCNKFVLQVISPSQVELLSKKSLEQIFPGVEWKGTIPNSLPHGLKQNDFWDTNVLIPSSEASYRQFEALKKLGNIGFLDKRFSDAIRHYNLSLDYSPDDLLQKAQILSNLSAAFLHLRCYKRALERSSDALTITPEDAKAIFRHAKALIKLKEYELASSFIKDKQRLYPEVCNQSKAIKDLLQAVSKILDNLSHPIVEIDMLPLLRGDSSHLSLEYTGPIRITEISAERGRGLVATKDISAGELLVTSKAFSFYCLPTEAPKDLAEKERIVKSSKFSLLKVKQNHQAALMNKLYFQPEELSGQFCNLYAGNLQESAVIEDQTESPSIPVELIVRIVKYNSFGTIMAQMENWELDKCSISQGIWIAPSFVNHSCSDFNAYCSFEGDFNVIRAVKDIKFGDEVLIPYVCPETPYRDRVVHIKKTYEFECTCTLCRVDKLDESTRPEITPLRMKYLDELRMLTQSLIPNSRGLKRAQGVVKQLAAIRKDQPRLNFYFLNPIVKNYAIRLISIGYYKEARDVFERIRWIYKENGRVMPVCRLDRLILRCLILLKDRVNLKKSIEIMKEDYIRAYGSTDLVELDCKSSLEQLKKIGISFF